MHIAHSFTGRTMLGGISPLASSLESNQLLFDTACIPHKLNLYKSTVQSTQITLT